MEYDTAQPNAPPPDLEGLSREELLALRERVSVQLGRRGMSNPLSLFRRKRRTGAVITESARNIMTREAVKQIEAYYLDTPPGVKYEFDSRVG